MFGKHLYSSDENPSLQKQIGCMNGILHLFDRRHGGGRHIAGHSHKRLPPGQSGQHTTEHNSSSQQDTETNLRKAGKGKQRTSTESSRTSFSSSSCSSTFSSVDSNGTAPTEPSFSTQCISPRTPTRYLPKNQKQKPSLCSGRQPPDFRDVVKDSIYKEAHGLSVRIATKEATAGHALKHIDSPRPSLSKSVETRIPSSNESPGVVARRREAPRSFNGEKDGPRFLTLKDRPRFSYDGRETREKAAIKLKELPRLSLDSREASTRCFTAELKPNCLSGNLQRENEETTSKNANLQQEPGSNKRPSSLVAKLMGLEDFPDTLSINEDPKDPFKTSMDKNSHSFSSSSRTDEGKKNQVAGSPRKFIQDSTSPRLVSTCSVARPIPSPKFPQETVPWRQRDVSQSPQIRVLKCSQSHTESNSPLTVYGEIEKSQIQSQTVDNNPNSSSPNQSPRLVNRWNPKRDHPIPARVKGTTTPKIVTMKPNQATDRSESPASSVITVGLSGPRKLQTGGSDISIKDLADKQIGKIRCPRNNHFQDPPSRSFHSMDKDTSVRILRSKQTSKEWQHSTRENTTSSRSSGITSPRLLQKVGLEKHSHTPTPSLEVSITRRPSNRQQEGSGSPGRKLQPKPSNLQRSDDELTKISNETRNFSYQEDIDSLLSSLASQIDREIVCTGRPNDIDVTFDEGGRKHQNTEARLNEDGKMVVPVAIQEQPSPVSVLDAMFYGDDSPSPVKKISNAFQDDETLNLDETWDSSDHEHLPQSTAPCLSLISHHKILEMKECTIQRHWKLNCADEEPSTSITPMGMNTNLDHGYIHEILLASSLLQENLVANLRGLQPHSSDHTINPNLFFVLEQTKASTRVPSNGNNSRKIAQTKFNEKIHRKLVFDTVDEILIGKLALADSSGALTSPRKLARRNIQGQQLLSEVCLEIDRLQTNSSDSSFDHEDEALKGIMWEDSAHQRNFHTEISWIVLDVERLIFKDLVDEIVKGEAAALKILPGVPCRQLFPK